MKADKLYYIVFSLFRPFYVEKPVPVIRKKKKIRTRSVYAPNFFKKILLRSFSVPRFQETTRPCSVPVLKFQNQPVYVPFPFPYMGTGTGKCTDSVPVLRNLIYTLISPKNPRNYKKTYEETIFVWHISSP